MERLDFNTTAILVLVAALADLLLGEPTRYHPLVGFGSLAKAVENLLYPLMRLSGTMLTQRFIGCVAVVLTIVPLVWLTIVVVSGPWWLSMPLHAAILYLAIGAKSLAQHARAIKNALLNDDLHDARRLVSYIVSRDTGSLQNEDICRAAIESVLENGNDAIFGAIFWFVLFGAPGAVAYRLSNTLDAMWGYKNERYLQYGWAAARLDDLLNWIPARITALSYSICGNFFNGIRCWRTQAKLWYSPNAGPVMAAGAGSLSIELGGAASYHGSFKQRPKLGCGLPPNAYDIERAVALLSRTLWLWLISIMVAGWLTHA